MLHVQDLARTSCQCVHFEDNHDIAMLTRALVQRGIQAPVLDGRTLVTKEELIGAIADVLRFPAYSAANWDSFDECIRDLAWLPGTGCVLFIRDAAALWRQAPKVAGGLINSWLAAAELWANDGVPLHLIFLL